MDCHAHRTDTGEDCSHVWTTNAAPLEVSYGAGVRFRGGVGGALTVLLAFALAGCETKDTAAPAPSTAKPTASSSFQELSESVWRAYFVSYTNALKDPSVPVSDVRPYLTDAEYEYVETQINNVRSNEVRVRGSGEFRNFATLDSSEKTALVCVDTSNTRIVDSKGKDVTPSNRPALVTLRLTFKLVGGRLLLDKDEKWSQSSAC